MFSAAAAVVDAVLVELFIAVVLSIGVAVLLFSGVVVVVVVVVVFVVSEVPFVGWDFIINKLEFNKIKMTTNEI